MFHDFPGSWVGSCWVLVQMGGIDVLFVNRSSICFVNEEASFLHLHIVPERETKVDVRRRGSGYPVRSSEHDIGN